MDETTRAEWQAWQEVVKFWPDKINSTKHDGLLGAVKAWANRVSELDVRLKVRDKSYIVMVHGSWGRGNTLKNAAKTCLEAGGKKTDRAIVRLVIGDAHTVITESGMLERHSKSEVLNIGSGFKLGQLLALED